MICVRSWIGKKYVMISSGGAWPSQQLGRMSGIGQSSMRATVKLRPSGPDLARQSRKMASSSRLPAQAGPSTMSSINTSPAAGGPTDHTASVRSLLEQVDRSSILASRFYPEPLRNHFLAIRAFNAEVARVADSVDNEFMARIRVAWWRDAIVAAFQGKPPRHPTVLAVTEAIVDPMIQRHGGLVQDHFVSICDAREADLSASLAAPTLESVERYGERTQSRLYYLSLNLLGVSQPVIDEIFSHLGKARGIAQSLMSVPFHAGIIRTLAPASGDANEKEGQAPARRAVRGAVRPRQRRLVLPREYLLAHGVVEEEVYRKGAEAKGLRDAVFDTATRANDYVISARTLLREEFKGKVPGAVIGPLVEASATTTFLTELQKRDFDVFDPNLYVVASGKGWRLPWNMWKVGLRGNL